MLGVKRGVLWRKRVFVGIIVFVISTFVCYLRVNRIVGLNPALGKHFLFNFEYFNEMCKCLDGQVVKALVARSNVNLHAWVRILLLAKYSFKLEKLARRGSYCGPHGPFQKYTLHPRSPSSYSFAVLLILLIYSFLKRDSKD